MGTGHRDMDLEDLEEIGDDEETAIEPRPARHAPGPAPPPATPAAKARPPGSARGDGSPPHAQGTPAPDAAKAAFQGFGDVDDETTELAARRSGNEPAPARPSPPPSGVSPRAVQISSGHAGVSPHSSAKVRAAPSGRAWEDGTDDDDETLRVQARVPDALPQRTPRPVPTAGPPQDTVGQRATKGERPSPAEDLRITRVVMPGGQRRPRVRDDIETSNTMPVGPPKDVDSEEATELLARPQHGKKETASADPEDGLIVMDVPDGAAVFVDGHDKGRGPMLRVSVPRHSSVTIRVEAVGHHPWSGTFHLEGRRIGRVKPPLKKREP